MSRFLLALSTAPHTSDAVESALQLAKDRGAELTVLFVLDHAVASTIFSQLTDIGFIGDRPSTDLKDAVSKEYRRQAEETLGEIERSAEEAGVDCSVEMIEGDFVEESLKAIARCDAEMIIIARARRSALSRLFLGSGIAKLLRQAPCEIKVFEEG